MNDNDNEMTQDKVEAETAVTPSEPTVASARRRLLKRGLAVAPVVLTLASRPALAWHCKSPSAWGSEIINPNTSLKNNAGHNSYIDETWTITNWTTNTPRKGGGLDGTGVTGQPWLELLSICPGLQNDSTLKTNSSFDYGKVTVGHLVTHAGITNPGFSSTKLVKDLRSTNLKTYPLIAQLNLLILKQLRFNNDIDLCLKQDQLAQMASGNYLENGNPWPLSKVKTYLYNNYIVRP